MILTASFQLVLVPKCCLARIICPPWCFPPGIVTNTRSIPFQFSSVVKGCYALKFPLSCSHNQPFYIHRTWGFTAGQLMGLSYFYSSTITTSWLREILKWIKQNSNNKKPFANLSLVLLYLYHKLWGYAHTCLLSPSFSQNLHCLTSSELDGSMGSPVRWIPMKVIYLGWIFWTVLCWQVFRSLHRQEIQLALSLLKLLMKGNASFLRESTSKSRQSSPFFPPPSAAACPPP